MYKIHFIAPNPKCPPHPEGEPFDSYEKCRAWADTLNDSRRGLGCLGHYEAMKA